MMNGNYGPGLITTDNNEKRPSVGWQCPKCGRGNSPYATVCPCGPDVEYTTATAGYVKLVKTRWGGYFTTADGE